MERQGMRLREVESMAETVAKTETVAGPTTDHKMPFE